MNLKRIKKLQVNATTFTVKWDKSTNGGWISYTDREIGIGTDGFTEVQILETVLHELWELAALENFVRFNRPDCDSDYLFVYDHRQHTAMTAMVTGWLAQFLE